MIICGNCKEQHNTSAEVRQCYDRTTAAPKVALATEKQIAFIAKLKEEREQPADFDVALTPTLSKIEASKIIAWLLKLPRKATTDIGDSVPEGRYAIDTGSDGVKFYKVDRPTDGRWKGYTFLKMLVGSPGAFQKYPIKQTEARAGVLKKIIAHGVRECAILFGRKTRHCGRCMSPLTDPRSRAAGYGERCAEVMGWPYPTKAEALRSLGESGEDEGDRLAFEDAARAEQRFEEQLETLGCEEAGIQDREEAQRGVVQFVDWTV